MKNRRSMRLHLAHTKPLILPRLCAHSIELLHSNVFDGAKGESDQLLTRALQRTGRSQLLGGASFMWFADDSIAGHSTTRRA